MRIRKTIAWLACAVAAIAPGAFTAIAMAFPVLSSPWLAAIAVGLYAFADSIVTLNVALRL